MSDEPIPQIAFDAPLTQRSTLDAWVTTVPLRPLADGVDPTAPVVITAGRPALQAPGSRAARTAAAVASLDAGQRNNWIRTGPRNITGRIRALTVHPTNPLIMYAGAAAGGVWKTTDGGETWAQLWRPDASSSIGGISVCRDHPSTVWVATGEHLTQILGSGVYVSNDDGATWGPDNAPVPGAGKAVTFDGIAAHPTNAQTCWAVGVTGIYRTTDSGVTWHEFETGVHYSDVAFSTGPAGLVVYLVRARSSLGEATVLRIDNPDDADAAVQASITNPNSASTPIAAAAAPPPPARPLPAWPGRGKIAICAGTPEVAYVRFALVGNDVNGGGHAGLFRAQNAQSAANGSAVAWTPIAGAGAPDFIGDTFGNYAMALGVNPNNANEIATGMVDVFVSLNANGPAAGVTFRRVMAQELFPVLDPAQHADNHATRIVPPPAAAPPGMPPTLWVANDGGIARSLDWQTGTPYPVGVTFLPLPDGAVSWRKSFGITASQMYSVSQSPLLPTTFGCGFQDNGVLFTPGGLTWRFLISGDGGFLAFDPDDPYKLIATWQREVDEVLFPGRLEGAFPPPGTAAGSGLWPRFLAQGFLPSDAPLFVGDTAHHPLHGDRLLNARTNRLYGSTEATGDAWRVEGAGRGIEVQLTVPPNTSGLLRVLPSTAGAILGIAPQVALAVAGAQPATASIRALLPGPYALQDGQQLNLQVTLTPVGGPAGAPVAATITFNRTPDKHGVPWSAAEAAGAIVGAGIVGLPCFWPRPSLVELATTDTGPNAQITLGGSALVPAVAGGLAPPGLRGRLYTGAANRPASATLIAPNVGIDTTSTMKVGGGQPAKELTVTVGANGSTRTITFDASTFVDLDWIHAGELQRVLGAALQSDPVTVTAVAAVKALLISGTGGANLQLGGTAATAPGSAPGLNLLGFTPPPPPPPAVSFIFAWPAVGNTFNLAPPVAGPLQLTINDGAVKPALTFNQPENSLRAITSEELQALLNQHFAANGINATCDLHLFYPPGSPSEIVYSRAKPDTAWVGGTDGTLYRTTNDGGRWDTIQDPLVYGLDRQVEAIAIHPADSTIVYVGLEGRPTAGVEDTTPLAKPGLIFKTTDSGATWTHVGSDVKDAQGGLLGAYALQIDPAAPDTVFVATDVGVFRTTDGGSSWQPFNEGLPPGLVRDLDFVGGRRALRAGVWGQGTFERLVGDTLSKDVSLYIRASEYDDGSTRPVPRGPDLDAAAPRVLRSTASPDIKNSRDTPPSLAAVTTIDGVAFDVDVVHEDPVHDAAGSTVYVQIHNRGAFPATAPRIACLWADASAGPPRLPDDFWTTFHAGALAGTVGSWNVIHDTRADAAGAVRNVAPSYPVVSRFAVAWPNDISSHRRVGILVLAECAEDPLAATQVDVGDLIAVELKAAYRECGSVRDSNDQTILIRQTSPAQFTVSAPAGPATPAGSIVPGGAGALPLGPVGSIASPTQATFPLAAGQALVFSMPPQAVTITFGAGIATPAAATAAEVINVMTRQLTQAGAPVALNTAGAPPVAQLRGGAGSLFQVTGGRRPRIWACPSAGSSPFSRRSPSRSTSVSARRRR